MFRQQQRFVSKVSRRAAGFCRTKSTEAVRDRSSCRETSSNLTAMPSDAPSQSGSNRTWNASQTITFASSSFHGTSENTSFWAETHTREDTRIQDENREDFESAVLSRRSTHQPDTQIGIAKGSSKPIDDRSSNRHAHPEGSLASSNENFRSPLGFHIPEPILREAIQTASNWHFTLYQGPGGGNDRVKVHYCKSKETTEKIAQLFLDEDVVGFDLEWKPSASLSDGITKNVSLIQIASEERVLLAHIARYPDAATSDKEQRVDDFVAPSLRKIMESPSISKVGVAIKADCTRLRRYLRIDSHGLFELSHLHNLVKYSTGDVKKVNKLPVALAHQVQDHLLLPLAKGNVRMSDWSHSVDLSYEQARYAASDTYAAFQLYYVLDAKRKALNPTPPRPAHAELNLPIRLADGHTVATVDEITEVIEDASINAVSNTSLPPEDELQKMAIEDTTPLYPQLPESPTPSTPSSSISSTPSPPPSKSPPPKTDLDPIISEAKASIDAYISTRPTSPTKTKPNRAHLRAHHLWQHHSMDADAIAALLRIDISTVATYVLQAIRVERFAFEESRTRALVPLAPMVLRDGFESMIERRVGKRDAAR